LIWTQEGMEEARSGGVRRKNKSDFLLSSLGIIKPLLQYVPEKLLPHKSGLADIALKHPKQNNQ